MKLITMNCPQCGGKLEISGNTKQAKCPFCNSVVMIDDEVNHIRFDNSEQAGYDFEQGRIKAQQDQAMQQAEYNQAYFRAQQEAERKSKNLKWWVLGWIFFFPIPLTILIVRTKKLKTLVKTILVAALWLAVILFLVYASNSGKALNTDSDNLSVWANEVTPLEDFDYYIDGETIVLKDYEGYNEKVNIAASYEMDGKKCKVVSLESTFTLESITSAIVPEGVKSIEDNTFNSCGVEYLYLPSTLTEFDGWTYFHNGQKLYYGGTEEQWNKLYTGERGDIDFKQIIFEADVNELINATVNTEKSTAESGKE